MLKVLSLFSGIGAFERALENLKIPHEVVNYCEIDKYASKAYSLLHGVSEADNLVDVTKIDTSKLPKDIDLVTYGFPCQDISLAGKQRGLEHEGEKTRSGLVWDAHKVIQDTMPKVALCENVKNLTGKKFKAEFEAILANLEEIGYNNYWQVLNAKDYGVPQNRERVFIVSIRKDIDKGSFVFPEKQPLVLRLKDILDEEVEEKFYLSEANLKWLKEHNDRHEAKGTGFLWKPKDGDDIASTLRANGDFAPTDNSIKVVGNYSPSGHEASRILDPDGRSETVKENHGTVNAVLLGNIYGDHCGTGFAGNVYDKKAISPALQTMQGGNRQPLIVDKPVLVGGIGEKNFGKQYRQGNRIYSADATAMALNAQPVGNAGGNSYLYQVDYRVRKLTPSECFKLMGFTQADAQMLSANKISNTQLYKMAGNSIVVDVLMAIFKELYLK